MAINCSDTSGIRFAASIWPSQKVELGWVDKEPFGDDGCYSYMYGIRAGIYVKNTTPLEEFRGMEVGIKIDSADVSGLQIAFVNQARYFRGLQLGVANRADHVSGVQLAVLENLSSTVEGTQMAFLTNDARVSMHGVQIAFLGNGTGVLGGMQLSMMVNRAREANAGNQLAVFINIASKLVIGNQFGIANLHDGIWSTAYTHPDIIDWMLEGRRVAIKE